MSEPETLLGKDGLEVIPFASKQTLYNWMETNHQTSPGIWLRMYKKASGEPSIVWAEAVEVCLCFGWIDSVVNRFDEKSYLQRLTPRRKRSVWSKINCVSAERLIEQGRMRPAGLEQIEAAKADGRWERAYDSPKDMKIPEDFLKALESHPKAKEEFDKLKKAELYFIGYSLTTAKKPETRQRRLESILTKLNTGVPLH